MQGCPKNIFKRVVSQIIMREKRLSIELQTFNLPRLKCILATNFTEVRDVSNRNNECVNHELCINV